MKRNNDAPEGNGEDRNNSGGGEEKHGDEGHTHWMGVNSED
jgi:hypothetical protein